MGQGVLDNWTTEPPTSDTKFLGSMNRVRKAIDKSKVNTGALPRAHFALGIKFGYNKGDTVHLEGRRDRNRIEPLYTPMVTTT